MCVCACAHTCSFTYTPSFHAVNTQRPEGTGGWISWSRSSGWLGHPVQVLRTKLWSSAKATSTLNCWTISPTSIKHFLKENSQKIPNKCQGHRNWQDDCSIVVNSTRCSCREPRFCYQNPHSSCHLAGTPVSGHLAPL